MNIHHKKDQEEKRKAELKEIYNSVRQTEGKFAGKTLEMLAEHVKTCPDVPITTATFRAHLNQGGELFVDCGNGYGDYTINRSSIEGGIRVREIVVLIGNGYGIKFTLRNGQVNVL